MTFISHHQIERRKCQLVLLADGHQQQVLQHEGCCYGLKQEEQEEEEEQQWAEE